MEDREPCPFRVYEDMGSAFCLGAVGGGPLWEEGRGIGKPAAPQSPPFIGPGQQSASPEQRR